MATILMIFLRIYLSNVVQFKQQANQDHAFGYNFSCESDKQHSNSHSLWFQHAINACLNSDGGTIHTENSRWGMQCLRIPPWPWVLVLASGKLQGTLLFQCNVWQ